MDVSFSSCVRLRLRCHISSLKQALLMILKKEKEKKPLALNWKFNYCSNRLKDEINVFFFLFSVAYINSWNQIFWLLKMCRFITRLYLLETALRSLLLGETLQRNMLKNNKLKVRKYKSIMPQLPAVCFHAGSLVTFISFSRVLPQRLIQPPLSTSMKKMQVCMK